MTENTEDRAKAICAVVVKAAEPPVKNVSAVVERLWPVVALEIQNGIADPDAKPLPNDMADRIVEHEQLHP